MASINVLGYTTTTSELNYSNTYTSEIRTLAANNTLTNGTTTQNIFSTPASYSFTTNTTYYVELFIFLTTGTTSHSISFGFATSVADATIQWQAIGSNTPQGGTNTASINVMNNAFGSLLQVTPADTSSGSTIRVWGTFVSTATAGTLTPQISFSVAPGGTNVTLKGSYMRVVKLGDNTFTNVGNWA